MLHDCMYCNSYFPDITVTQLMYGPGIILTFVRLMFSMDTSAEAHLAAEYSGTYILCETAVIHFALGLFSARQSYFSQIPRHKCLVKTKNVQM